jgi:hypothetical protein
MKNLLCFALLFFFTLSLFAQKRGCPSCTNNNKPAYYNPQRNFKKAQRDHSLRTATGEVVPAPSVDNNFNQQPVGESNKAKIKKSKKKKNTPIRQ